MSILTSEKIVQGIAEGKPLAPFDIDSEILDRYTDFVLREKLTLDSEANEVAALLRQLKPQLPFVSEERRSQLSQCQLFVLPFPLCISYAWKQSGYKTIVMGRGFIDLLANVIQGAIFQSTLPSELDERYRKSYKRNMPASELLANALLLLQLRFYQFCEPLPNIDALLSAEIREQSHISIGGALLFTLLHELGHHELGHIDNDHIWPMSFVQISPESVSADQHQEIEADAFALDSLIETAKAMGPYWQQQAVNFFVQMELISGQRSGAEHPLALNRAFHAHSVGSVLEQQKNSSSRELFFKDLAIRYMDTQTHTQSGENLLVKTTREGCLRVLDEINEILKEFDLDISQLWESGYPSWLETDIT
ncbi:MAG: hypothetical protein AB2809_21320 [Candidatus Thiodiazotropha sp.]